MKTICKHETAQPMMIRDNDAQLKDFNFVANFFHVPPTRKSVCICPDCSRLLPSVRLRNASAVNVDRYDENEELN